MVSPATNKTVIAIVLAAGSSSRFGATKQLAEIDGVPLVRRAVDAAHASRAAATVVVVGHDWQAVSAAVGPGAGFTVRNDSFEDGMGSSLSLAVRASRHAADAIVVLLADQPLVTAAHIDTLIDSWSGAANEIVATAFNDTSGAPALFAEGCFDDLAQLSGDTGARALLQDSRFTVRSLALAEAAIDVDVPADLNPLQRNAHN